MDLNNTAGINGIVCDVNNCVYNRQRTCHADQVKVGPQFAASTSDTVCDTFRPQ
jgi:hypothetical protein